MYLTSIYMYLYGAVFSMIFIVLSFMSAMEVFVFPKYKM